MILVRLFLRLFRRTKQPVQQIIEEEEILPLNIEHLQRNVEKEKFDYEN